MNISVMIPASTTVFNWLNKILEINITDYQIIYSMDILDKTSYSGAAYEIINWKIRLRAYKIDIGSCSDTLDEDHI